MPVEAMTRTAARSSSRRPRESVRPSIAAAYRAGMTTGAGSCAQTVGDRLPGDGRLATQAIDVGQDPLALALELDELVIQLLHVVPAGRDPHRLDQGEEAQQERDHDHADDHSDDAGTPVGAHRDARPAAWQRLRLGGASGGVGAWGRRKGSSRRRRGRNVERGRAP